MKLCILGDTHFGARGDSLFFHNFFQKFYDEVFFPYLEENEIDTVIQLGDMFDRRKFINFNSLYLVRKYFFDKCVEKNVKVITLLGNHDITYKNTLTVNSSSLLLNDYKNITIIDKFETLKYDGVDIDIVPWICDENEEEIYNQMKKSKSQICFGHFEIAGFEMEKGQMCDSGTDRKIFSKYDVVLSGHFHHKSTGGNITYVGTPYEMTWADYSDVKGFHIFDTDTREMEFVKNPFSMFIKIKYDDSETDFEYWKKYNYSLLKDCYVKLIAINKQNPFLFDSVLDNIYKAGVCDLSIVEDFTELTLEDDEELIDQAEDTMTILSKYIDGLTVDVEVDKLKTLMRELYIEAINTEQTE